MAERASSGKISFAAAHREKAVRQRWVFGLAGEGVEADLLLSHVRSIDPGNHNRLLHGIAPEGFAQFLVENHFDKGVGKTWCSSGYL
ncbi:hypothetical protein [Cypionkella sp.]|uniref:hypothetical protein n=1 Tax=Cypionkella sp. TaxID=2811411 RepID=UPI002ABC7C63|nr:hypothetical protein [Cypionkella sp.]MDZ4392516.1 hypothetical protein [Cypionkella sp.]